jgi:2-polyprenyl-6-methoxyphenol hydroxylase-like FAD-dependent oxidoreductase
VVDSSRRLWKILYNAAIELGVRVLLGSPVKTVEEHGPTVVLKNGQQLSADLVAGADEIRSRLNEEIHIKEQRCGGCRFSKLRVSCYSPSRRHAFRSKDFSPDGRRQFKSVVWSRKTYNSLFNSTGDNV